MNTAQKGVTTFHFILKGQLPGGKNRIKTTRTGHRYPDKRFVEWRADALAQLPNRPPRIDGPVAMIVDYTPGDRRIRDMDAMLGTLGHLLCKAGVLEDDAQIVALHWHPFPMDRDHPQCIVTLNQFRWSL